MKILLINREDLLSKFGGDSIKTLKTKEYLEKNGIKVDLILGKKEVDLKDYDLIHIFNLQNIQLTPWWIKKAKLAKKPIVLTTIWWRSKNTETYLYEIYKRYHSRYKLPIKVSEKTIGRYLSQKIFKVLHRLRFSNREKYAVENTDWLIAESKSEIEEMGRYFNYPEIFDKSVVIPNGLNEKLLDKNPTIADDLTSKLPPDFVLTTGRIDPIKNQVNIIKSLFEEKEIPLVFIGSKSGPLSYKDYVKEFEMLLEKRGNVYWFDNLSQSQLKEFYRRAKVYAQPSVWETFGMAIFEAAVFGCNLAITTEGGAKDYFKDKAFYCNPFNLKSIKTSILSALKKPKNNQLRDYLRKELDWNKIAIKIIEVYKKVLSY